ncbi:hypothetical protein AGMMS49938_17670 [Fibrobacterales bacterium]|nr:hypothetical protein AGMMS49938_17670 [Fibrobacterales bacterium]
MSEKLIFKPVSTLAEARALFPLIKEIWEEVFIPICGEETIDCMLKTWQNPHNIIKEIENGAAYFSILCSNVISEELPQTLSHKIRSSSEPTNATETKTIGYLAYELWKEPKNTTNALFISKFYLKKEFRGNGFSHQMFNFFENSAKENNKKKLHLHVNRKNYIAIEVYKKHGFKIIKSIDYPFPFAEGIFLYDHWMEKELP